MSLRASLSLVLFIALASARVATAEYAHTAIFSEIPVSNAHADVSSQAASAVLVDRADAEQRWLLNISDSPVSPVGISNFPAPVVEFSENSSGVTPVPPPPSSLLISVASLLGLGVFAGGRHVASAASASLPDWYHAERAVQVGHSTPLPLDFCLLSPLLGAFEVLPDQDSPKHVCISYAAEFSRFQRQEAHLCLSIPRGPPALF